MKEIFEKLNEAKKILIVTHVNPDGDTLGCAVAMKSYLGDKADIVLQLPKGKTYPETYEFLPYIAQAKLLSELEDIYDTVLCLDVASIDRIVENAREIFNKAKVTINIDHHITNNNYAQFNLVCADASSAGEVLFDFFEKMGIEITPEIANALYVSILTDTGCFKYESVSPKTFEIAGKLLAMGVNTSEVAKKCYDQKPKAMVKFQAHCLNATKFLFEDRIAICKIYKNDMTKFGAKDEYTEGVAESMRSIKTVEISCVLKEVGQTATKVSLRSKEKDIIEIAKAFNGGGHVRACGCTIRKPINQAYELLVAEIEKHLD